MPPDRKQMQRSASPVPPRRETPTGQARPDSAEVEAAVRAAFASGIDLPFGVMKTKRVIRNYLTGTPQDLFDVEVFMKWLYRDPTGDKAAHNMMREQTHE